MAKPWYTSDALIDAVKRKISIPTYQGTFTDEDILAFANEEMMISQVPSVLQFNEEYFVFSERVPLRTNVSRYPIPKRAVGMRIRDLVYCDNQNNLSEMTRVDPDDKAYFQYGSNQQIPTLKFYVEGNDIVLTDKITTVPAGSSLIFYYYIRPNQLVKDENAAKYITTFKQNITIDNTTLVNGNSIIIDNTPFIAGTEFTIGATSIDTATNLVAAINTANIGITASNDGGASNIVILLFRDVSKAIIPVNSLNPSLVTNNMTTNNSVAIQIPNTIGMTLETLPDTYVVGGLVDLLETDGGHRIKAIDKPIIDISGTDVYFNISDVPYNMSVGDYFCNVNECIIPYLPSDLHNGLAERAGGRILASIGDSNGLAVVNSKLQEIETRQGTLLDNRVESAPLKVTSRKGILSYNKAGLRRRN